MQRGTILGVAVNKLRGDRMAWEELSSVYDQLHQCAFQIEDLARVKERQRIARDLHDSLGHALTAINVQLQTALKLWKLNPAEAELFLTQAQRLGVNAIKEVRQSVCSLRATANTDQPLEELIESLVADFQLVTDVSISTSINLSADLPQEVSTALYRVVQEALTNIRKHAAATAVQIQIDDTIPCRVQLVVTDNGKGFRQDTSSKGFGLQGMAERVAALAGLFDIETEPGKGCQIRIEVPLQQQQIVVQNSLAFADENPTITIVKSVKHSILCHEQSLLLEEILTEYVGPIAPTVLQKVTEQTPSCQELVTKLLFFVPALQRSEFEQRLSFLFNSSPSPEQTTQNHFWFVSSPTTSDFEENSICQCKQHLTNVVEPIAPLLTQRTLAPSFETSRIEDVSTLEVAQPVKRLILTDEQFSRLEKILAQYVGAPVASLLLQKETQQSLSCQELVAKLLLYIPIKPIKQRSEFEQRVSFLVDSQPSMEEVTQRNTYELFPQIRSDFEETFLALCEEQLTNFIGPIAELLIQQTLASSPDSPSKLVEMLMAEIPDAQMAVEFQKALSDRFNIGTQPSLGGEVEVVPLQQQALEQKPLSFSTDVSTLEVAQPIEGLVLTDEQSSRLEKILAQYVGTTVASRLLEKETQQTLSCQELVAELLLYIPLKQRTEFEQRVSFLFDSSPSIEEITREYFSDLCPQIRSESFEENFIRQCEEQLTDLVGPIAELLIQETLASCPDISPSKLVEMLVAEIPDAKIAAEFQQRMGS